MRFSSRSPWRPPRPDASGLYTLVMRAVVRAAPRLFLAFQELLVLLHLAPLVRGLRVQLLHLQLLPGRQAGKMPQEGDEVPCLFLALFATVSPGGPPVQPDSVLDDVEKLTIGELLRPAQAEIRCRGKQVPTHLRVAAPVVRMADGAVVGEVGAALGEDVASGRLRVALVAGRLRNADPPQF